MLAQTFFLAISIGSILADPPVLQPRNLIRLTAQDPPVLQPRVDNAPQITPRQSSSCSNVNFAFSSPGQTGYLQSGDYPYDYPENQDCSYFISSPEGTTMTISCDTFNVDCDDVFYTSLSGDSSFSDASYYCGNGYLAELTTSGNKLSVGFYTDSSNPYSYDYYRYNCKVTVSQGTAPAPAPSPAPAPAPAPAPVPAPSGTCCGIRNVNGATRIVGGTQTKTGEIPWRVALFISNSAGTSGYLCGGTIISKSWVMTAAHCVAGMAATDKVTVYTEAQANPIRFGGGVANAVSKIVKHPSYNSKTMDNDITLLKLATPLTFKSNVFPACLPWQLVGKNMSGSTVLASGWGTTRVVPINTENNDPSSDTLLKVDLPLLTTEECAKKQSGITDNMICTFKPGYDTCQGDSGGSIDFQDTDSLYYSVGVVSYGYGCATNTAPGVYSKVTKYLPWIQTTAVGETFCNQP